MVNKKQRTLNAIILGLKHKICKINLPNVDHQIIQLFYTLNIVTNLTKIGGVWTVHLNTALGGKVCIKNYYKRHNKIFYSSNQISKMRWHLHETVYVFSTPRGYQTQTEMIKNHSGGFLVFQLLVK